MKTTAGKGGDITDSFTYTEDEDTVEEVIIYADTGYFIESVTINGKAQTVSDRVGIGEQQGVYTFRKEDQTIEATFTNEATANTKAGKVTLVPNKTEIRKYDEVDIEISFEPENTNEKSKYVIDISDYGFISSDKGTFSGTSVTGTIDFGKKKEVVHLKVRYSDGTLDGVVTATLYNETFKAVVESDIFLISEEDMSPPPEDDIILDKEDILDEDFDEEEEGHSHIVPISIAGIIIVALLAAVFVIRRKRKN